ncbi:unnamed protein product, partial [Sphagnum compactum]
MRRDWIQTGRHPAGICGACLLIAARMYGFSRTQKEILYVVRVCDITLRRRLAEFSRTPSGKLTPEEFHGVWLEEEIDPPSFSRNRRDETKKETIRKGSYFYSSPVIPASQRSLLEGDLSVLDEDSEVSACILQTIERELKTKLWMEANKDYLESQEEFAEWTSTTTSSLAINSILAVVNFLEGSQELGGRVLSAIYDWVPNLGAVAKRSGTSVENGESGPSLDKKGVGSSGIESDFSVIIKQMIEIKQLLRTHGLDDTLGLPNIVVIGAQSAGKSSVLEALVGHSFLPKGTQMVTRRPLSLTLVHSPSTANDYAVFPGLQYGSIYDFSTVKTILDELNGAVPEVECIDESPIELVIYSSSVPDLCLIDLPGFIQIPSRAQPSQLRDRIRRLCQKYIEPASNIILAVSAADVDLANSEALKASRIVDPHGTRTIGVLTKLDLVDQNLGHSLLSKGINEYPLPLGYIGLALGSKEWGKNHPENFGVSCLRKRLAESLGAAMSSSVHRVYEEVSRELSALDLQFKVQYNDQRVSADVYMSFLMESLRNHIRKLETNLSRSTVSEKLSRLMEIRLLETIAPGFRTSVVPESDSKFSIPVVDLRIWQESLSKLTKSHIGTMATEAIRRDILDHMRTLGEMEHFRHHPQLVASIIDSTESFLDVQLPLLTLHLENAVKPFKKGTLFSPGEWNASRETVVGLLHHCVESLDKKLASISKEVGSKRLKQAMVALEDVNSTADLSPYMSQKAFEASGLLKHISLMKERISLLECSALCSTPQTVAN